VAVTVDGADPVAVDLSGATTVGDLCALLEAVPGLSVGLAAGGNRLTIGGDGLQSVEIADVEGDGTAGLLGLTGSAVPIRPFGALIDLKQAVAEGDRARVRALLPELEALESHFTTARATAGNRLSLAEDALTTLTARNFTMTATLSEIGDADMTAAIVQYQSAEAIYQASLVMAANIFQLTLSNYL
jgi:flagellin-like hook-associated protein FlgL